MGRDEGSDTSCHGRREGRLQHLMVARGAFTYNSGSFQSFHWTRTTSTYPFNSSTRAALVLPRFVAPLHAKVIHLLGYISHGIDYNFHSSTSSSSTFNPFHRNHHLFHLDFALSRSVPRFVSIPNNSRQPPSHLLLLSQRCRFHFSGYRPAHFNPSRLSASCARRGRRLVRNLVHRYHFGLRVRVTEEESSASSGPRIEDAEG